MKNLFLLTFVCASLAFSQNSLTTENSRYTIAISYGPQYNNFVDYDQELVTRDGNILPLQPIPVEDALLQKREIGTFFNARFSFRVGGRNYLELGHARTLNQGVYSGFVNFPNETLVLVEDFQLRHRNFFYEIGYKRLVDKYLSLGAGLAHLSLQQEVININSDLSTVEIAERNETNSNLAELASYLDVAYDFYSSGTFTLGVHARTYFIISYGPELETFTVAPYLRFNF